MNENTRKYYFTQGENFEKASEYEKALSSYLEAFSVKEKTDEDDDWLFAPGFLEDIIALLAYKLGKFSIATSFGTKAHIANRADSRLATNTWFYQDALLITNPKWRLDNLITNYIKEKFGPDSSVLDIGPLDGRWRDYLKDHFKHMDAVEAFEPYVEQYGLRDKYDNVFISDINDFEFEHYDLIIMGDVLEHIETEKAQALVKRIIPKCNQFIVIVPFEFSQDEIDNNEFQAHKQEDITKEIFAERYPELELLMADEARGVYIKKGTLDREQLILGPIDEGFPKTYIAGIVRYNMKDYSIAAGIFSQSVEPMSDEQKALMKYKLGICYRELDKKLESLKAFSEAVEALPSYENAYFEIMKILEKLELWSDLEYYIKKALDNIRETNNIDENKDPYWKGLLLIQMTLVLSKLHKPFEAYGYAALALETPMGPERKKIAEYNYNELKKELRGTLQIYDK